MKRVRWTIAILISLTGLWFVFRGFDAESFKASLKSMKSPGLLLLFPVFTIFEFSMRTLRWQILFSPLRKVSFTVFLPITAAGFFINNVLPFRAGEAARVYWSHQKTGVPVSSCMAILVVDRVFDMCFWGTNACWNQSTHSLSFALGLSRDFLF